jgi:hypothetical protein
LDLAVAGFFILPFYIAMLIAYSKIKYAKIELEFVATANHIEKKVKFDDAVERLFEEGEAL